MRYAVISDIHGNLEALEEVLKSIAQNKVDEILCLGDIVGYGPNSNECAEMIRKMNIKGVVGNHDFVMIDEVDLQYFNPIAQVSARWTKSILGQENLQYLACLPFIIAFPEILLVHASPSAPRSWNYILSIIDALGEFRNFQEKICFVGHSHIPVIFSDSGDALYGCASRETVSLSQDRRYVINVGSVGQPRDNDPRACYGILDTDLLTFSLVRVKYDMEKVVQKIKAEGLPEFLGQRLLLGI